MSQIVISNKALEQLTAWAHNDPKTLKKIFELISDIRRSPFEGIGKPEPLKY